MQLSAQPGIVSTAASSDHLPSDTTTTSYHPPTTLPTAVAPSDGDTGVPNALVDAVTNCVPQMSNKRQRKEEAEHRELLQNNEENEIYQQRMDDAENPERGYEVEDENVRLLT